ncbi:MAG: heme NO-binding domain-containing protein [Chitinophagales bacterium]|nr:heme NO-binding domain-containing protein [Chitinophagales bacterium]
MYGIVNQAIQGLVTEQFGEDTWMEVKKRSNIDFNTFLSNESYDDSVTYQLAGATSEVLGISVDQVLEAFGEYWVLKTGQENYGSLLKAGGRSLKEFLVNLPNFHSRVMLMYPNLTPPEFRISHIEDRSLQLHYYSEREGLVGFVRGLIQGLGKMFDTTVETKLLQSRDDGSDHEVFYVEW